MDRPLRNTAATNTAAPSQLNQVRRQGGFKNKHHDQDTKNRISSSQKARYDYMRQMMGQHLHQEQNNSFGPIDFDDPKLNLKIKEIVREILNEEIKKAIPIRQNIPLF